MPISAQDATITWGNFSPYTLTEVIDYTVDTAVGYAREPGDFGTVTVRSLTNALPSTQFGRYRMLTIEHNGTVVFKAGCVADRLRIEAVTNDVLRYVVTFRVIYPSRNF